MAGDMRLAGDLMTYDSPENTDVIAVAERRKGLPVALGVFYLDAARRCGLDVQGVDFPGHFLLRIETARGAAGARPVQRGPRGAALGADPPRAARRPDARTSPSGWRR